MRIIVIILIPLRIRYLYYFIIEFVRNLCSLCCAILCNLNFAAASDLVVYSVIDDPSSSNANERSIPHLC